MQVHALLLQRAPRALHDAGVAPQRRAHRDVLRDALLFHLLPRLRQFAPTVPRFLLITEIVITNIHRCFLLNLRVQTSAHVLRRIFQ